MYVLLFDEFVELPDVPASFWPGDGEGVTEAGLIPAAFWKQLCGHVIPHVVSPHEFAADPEPDPDPDPELGVEVAGLPVKLDPLLLADVLAPAVPDPVPLI